MKKIFTVLLLICLAFSMCINSSAMEPAYLNNIVILGEEAIVMRVGETITLDAVADAQGINIAYMYWHTDDTDIVNLVGDKGTTENTSLISTATITALNTGKAVISVYSEMGEVVGPYDFYENDSVVINVVSEDDSYVSKIRTDFIWYDMYVGEELKSIFAEAYPVGDYGATFLWEVDNEEMIQILNVKDEFGLYPASTLDIRALSPGLATIYVYADTTYPQVDKSKAACSTITINITENNDQKPPSSNVHYLTLKSDYEKTIYVGEEINIAAIAEQSDYRRDWAYFTWASSDQSIVDVDSNNVWTVLCTPAVSIGKLKGVKEGTAVITVYANSSDVDVTDEHTKKQSITINVIPKENTPSVKTEILNNIFIVTPTDVPEDSTIIFACYKGKSLVYIDTFDYQGSRIVPFVTNEDYDNAKVMVFDKMSNMIPLCEAEEVKLP